MKKLILYYLALFMLFLSSCSLFEGIFKAGVWVGVLIVVGVIFLLIFIIVKIFKS